jgi:signal peptidase I
MPISEVKTKITTGEKTTFDFVMRKLGFNSVQIRKAQPIFDTCLTIFYALILATVFRMFFFENFKIPSGSMNPLLLKGDRVVVSKFYYGYSNASFPFNPLKIKDRILSNRKPKRGDVVVFKHPSNENKEIFYIKRIIGLPNDRIQVKKGVLFVNGVACGYKEIEMLNEKTDFNHNPFPSMKYIEKNIDGVEYSVLISDTNSYAGNTKEYIVPEGYYFVMGDNRDNSKDSRFADFSTIPFKEIVGKAEWIFFSTANGKFSFKRVFKSLDKIA